MTDARLYTSKRRAIATALSEKLKNIDGSGGYLTDLSQNVLPKLVFWDEIDEFPAVHISTGREYREYQGGGYKDRYLNLTLRCYVKDEDDPQQILENLLGDLETVIEENSRLAYQTPQGENTTHDITIQSIDTDEGVLAPLGVGEMLLLVHY